MDVPTQSQRLSRCQIIVIVFAAVLGLALAGYGAAGSYETIRELADQPGLPLPGFVPVDIDGGLIGTVVLDLLLAWTAQSLGWLRQLSRVLTASTVVANAAGGWPDLISVGLHVAAPVMLLAMVEAARTVLFRRLGAGNAALPGSDPGCSVAVVPVSDVVVGASMTLWQVAGYHAALDVELKVRRSDAQLHARYGRHWVRHVPADLVWMLRNGVFLDEAYAAVTALTSSPELAVPYRGDAVSDAEADVRRDAPLQIEATDKERQLQEKRST